MTKESELKNPDSCKRDKKRQNTAMQRTTFCVCIEPSTQWERSYRGYETIVIGKKQRTDPQNNGGLRHQPVPV